MIADAMTSIKAYLYEKAVSPLLGSLIISWCAWNYKFLLMLVSGLSFPDKLRYINILYTDDYLFYGQGIIFPFITSMVYLFVFPFPAKWVYQFSLKRQQVLNELKNKVQENELLTLEQSKAIRNQLAETEKHFEDLVERKERALEARDKEISELRTLLKSENNESMSKAKADKTSEDKTSEDKATHQTNDTFGTKVQEWLRIGVLNDPKTTDEFYANILIRIYKNGGTMRRDELVSGFVNKTKGTYYLDDLTRKNIISYSDYNEKYIMSHSIKGYFVIYT
ncbi:TPA: hypothetical protein ACX6Q6_002742 [Photobacterium damselae]